MPGILPAEQVTRALQGGQQPAGAAGPATPQQQMVSLQFPTAFARALETGFMGNLSAADQAQVSRIRQQYGAPVRYFDAGRASETPISTYLFAVQAPR